MGRNNVVTIDKISARLGNSHGFRAAEFSASYWLLLLSLALPLLMLPLLLLFQMESEINAKYRMDG